MGELSERERAKFAGMPPSRAAALLSEKRGRPVSAEQIIRLGKAGSFKMDNVGLPGATRSTWAVHEASFMAWLAQWGGAGENAA